MMRTAIVIGATGLVGTLLLQMLCADKNYSKIQVVARRKTLEHPKIEYLITDFEQMEAQSAQWTAQDAFCCLGTTIKQAGSKANFYKVDYTYTVHFAHLVAKRGIRQFLLVSATGADLNSFFFYNQVKAQAENAIKSIRFEAIHIFRPSLLLGERQERRLGEDIGKILNKVFSPIIPNRYKGIEASQVAKAMLRRALATEKGIYIHESEQIAAQN